MAYEFQNAGTYNRDAGVSGGDDDAYSGKNISVIAELICVSDLLLLCWLTRRLLGFVVGQYFSSRMTKTYYLTVCS